MYYIRILDFTLQTLLLLILLALLIFPYLGSPLLNVLAIQLVLGVTQMTSSVISNLIPGAFLRDKRRHLIASICYLLTLIVGATLQVPESFAKIWLTVPACLLALYYYFLSLRRMQYRNGGTFLPHTSF